MSPQDIFPFFSLLLLCFLTCPKLRITLTIVSCTSSLSLKHIQCRAPATTAWVQNVLIFPDGNCAPYTLTPQTLVPPLYFLGLTTLGTSYRWVIQRLSVCDWPTIQHNVLKVHPCCDICQNELPFLRLNNVPPCVHLTFGFGGPLGGCHALALVHNAAVDMDVHQPARVPDFSSVGCVPVKSRATW